MSLLDQVHSILIQKIIDASPKRRNKIIEKLIQKPGKVENTRNKRLDYNRNGKWTKELIVEVLKKVCKEHGKLTIQILEKLRKSEPQNYPAPTTVRLRFGSWKAAKKAVGGKAYPPHLDMLGGFDVKDVNYFLNMYHQGGIKTYKDYVYARKEFPESVPPYCLLRKIFGSFKNYIRVAELDSCKDQLNKLLQLTIKLNQFPTKFQCKDKGIDIKHLIERFKTRSELKEFILDLKIGIEMAIEEEERKKEQDPGSDEDCEQSKK